ncbi:dimethylaniline monooxygenase [N-oxide-forming] 5-like protein, partial [Dinothrombium tinctorium]
MYRVGPYGNPFDGLFIRRFIFLLFSILPFSLSNFFFEKLMDYRFDHAKYKLKPKHRLLGQHPMVNDALPNRILSGTVVVKGNIER